MPSRIPTVPRREPLKADALMAPKASTTMRKSRPAPLATKAATKLPVPSQPLPTAALSAPLKKHLHTRSTTTTSTRIPQSPQPTSMPLTPMTKSAVDSVHAYKQEPHGLLTPASAAPKSPHQLSFSGFPSSPKAPRKQDLDEAPILHSPSSKLKSPYQHAHIADPCIRGALVHHLSCGHKVMTRVPQQCNSNCQRPLPEFIEKYANIKNNNQAFVCASCVEALVQRHREAKRTIFIESFKKMEGSMMGVTQGWMKSQMEYWERVWENDTEKEKAEFAKLGEACSEFPREPASVDEPSKHAVGESTALPWPPKKKPQKVRSPSKVLKMGQE